MPCAATKEMQLTLDVIHCCLNKHVDPVEYRSNHVNLTKKLNKIDNIRHTNAKMQFTNMYFHNNKANIQIVGQSVCSFWQMFNAQRIWSSYLRKKTPQFYLETQENMQFGEATDIYMAK